MDINTFYAVTAATCFTLVGLWWSVVKDKAEWMKDEAKKRLAGGVYASFLIPALMSLGAQIGGTTPFLWQLIFSERHNPSGETHAHCHTKMDNRRTARIAALWRAHLLGEPQSPA